MEAQLIHESTFSVANPSSYSLSEIWPISSTHSPPSFDHHSHSHNHNKRKESSSITTTTTTTTTTPNHLTDSGNKHIKLGGSSDASSAGGNILARRQGGKASPEAPKQDYIHVRARRGQATDSHSLAERARREKISERMKILQDIVPGCNKVIGKALVLDEIINYIQSLQRQVEFLSMKLEAVNSRLNMNPTVECFPSKDVGTQPFDLAGMIFGPQANRVYAQGSPPGWLHMQLGGGFERET